MDIINQKSVSAINEEVKKKETKEEMLSRSIVQLKLDNLQKEKTISNQNKILNNLGKQFTLMQLELLKKEGK